MFFVEMWQVQDFLLRFDLGPPEGFKDDDHEAEDDFSAVASVGQPGQHEVEVKLGRLVFVAGWLMFRFPAMIPTLIFCPAGRQSVRLSKHDWGIPPLNGKYPLKTNIAPEN